jgi:hypothetical protein
MKLSLLGLGLTILIVNAIPVAEPAKAACYYDPDTKKELCTHPTPVTLLGWPTPTPTSTSSKYQKRAKAGCWFGPSTTHCHTPALTTPAPMYVPRAVQTFEKRQCMVLSVDYDGTLHQKCGTSVIACKDGACRPAPTPTPSDDSNITGTADSLEIEAIPTSS